MAIPPSSEITLLLQRGIAAARSNRSVEALQILEQVVEADPDNEMAWLWLSGLVTTKEQKRVCLEKVLQANPENVYARAGLTRLHEASLADADELEARLAFAANGNGSPPSVGDSSKDAQSTVRPPLKRIKPTRSTDAKGTNISQNSHKVSETAEPTESARPDHTSAPHALEPTCPACDEPISATAKMCPYCFMPFRSLEELLGYNPQNPFPNSPQSYKRKRKNILGHLGSVISS